MSHQPEPSPERGPDVWPMRMTIGGLGAGIVAVVSGIVLLASLRCEVPRDLGTIGLCAVSALAALLPGVKLRH